MMPSLPPDLTRDAHELLIMPNVTNFYYPNGEMTAASVVSLMDVDDLARDAFLQTIIQTVRKTRHNAQQLKFRLRLINFDDTSDTIEFSSELEYWNLIAAVRKALDQNIGASYSGRCTLIPNNNEAASVAATSRRGLGLGLFSAQRGDVKCQLIGTKLVFRSENGIEDKLDLQEVKALSLSADYVPVENMMFICSLHQSDDSIDERLACYDKNRQLVIKYSISGGSTMMLPVSMKDFAGRSLPEGIDRLVITRTSQIGGAESSGNLIAAEFEIPFDDFIDSEVSSFNSLGPFQTPKKSFGGVEEQRPPNLLFDKQCVKQITLKTTSQFPAAYRVVIRGAQSLPLDGKKPPSSYCTVYLVNEKGERLTVNTVDARTDIAQSTTEPEWNKEFLLRYDGQDVNHRHSVHAAPSDVPTGVMIKIRDSASGFLRHKHIGQVVVPINCFIYQTEATFTLPLDPTYRMNAGSMAALGEVHLLTELVSINPETGTVVRVGGASQSQTVSKDSTPSVITPPRLSKSNTFRRREDDGALEFAPPRPPPSSPGRMSRKDSKESFLPDAIGKFSVSEERKLSVICSLAKCSAWASWWPMRTLSNSSVDARGHIHCGHGALRIRLLAGSAGSIVHCEEAKQINSNASSDERVTEVCLPWSQVISLIELTEAVLLASVVIKSCISTPSEIAKQQFRYSETEIDLLIAPCPATQMRLVMNHRIAASPLRGYMDAFCRKCSSLGVSLSTSVDPGDTTDSRNSLGSSPPKSSSAVSSPRTTARKSLGARDAPDASINNKVSYSQEDITTMLNFVHTIMDSIETSISDSKGVVQRWSSGRGLPRVTISAINSCSLNGSDSCSQPSRKDVTDFGKVCMWVRAVWYYSVLRRLCESLYQQCGLVKVPNMTTKAVSPIASNVQLPVYSVDAIRKRVEIDISELQLAQEVDISAVVATLSKLFTSVVNCCNRRLRELLLFAPLNCENLKELARAYIAAFHAFAKSFLSRYSGSKEGFLKLPSEQSKMDILKLIITKNTVFQDGMSVLLSLVGMEQLADGIILLTALDWQKVSEWFSTSLVSKSSVILSTSIADSKTAAISKANLPLEIVSSTRNILQTSTPCSLMAKLQQLLDMCIEVTDAEAAKVFVDAANSKVGNTHVLFGSEQNAVGISTRNIDDFTAASLSTQDIDSDKKTFIEYLCLNDRIIGAVSKSYIRFGEEYRRILQSKHWEQGDKVSGEMFANMQFLLAVANDCHTVVTLIGGRVIRACPVVAATEAVLGRLLTEFSFIQDISCRLLCRCFFSGLSVVVVDFDTLWATGNDTLKSFTTALNYSFRDIEQCAELPTYCKILGFCADICCVRYFLMLKERCNSGNQLSNGANTGGNNGAGSGSHASSKLSPSELDRVVADCQHFIDTFEKAAIVATLSTNLSTCASDLLSLSEFTLPFVKSYFQQYEASCVTKLLTAIACMKDLRALLTASFDTEAYSTSARSLVRRYKIASASSSFCSVANGFLNSICTLRPDSCTALQTLTTVILEHHGSRLSGAESHLQAIKAHEFGSVTNSSKHTSTVMSTETGSSADTFLDYYDDPISRVFGTKQSEIEPEQVTAANNSSTTTPMKTKKPLISTPFTLKQLREKTSDVLSNLTHRRPDNTHGAELMRLLGLEDDSVSIVNLGLAGEDNAVLFGKHASASNVLSTVGGSEGTSKLLSDAANATATSSARTCNFTVSDIKVRGLATNSLFSSANPYVAVMVGDQREKTAVVHNVSSCSWSQKLEFHGIPNTVSAITAQVFDKELVRRKRSLGAVTVSLVGVENGPIQGWFVLEGGELKEGAHRGEIYLCIRIEV